MKLIKVIFLLLLSINAYAVTDRVRYINTASSGGDGTTNDTRGIGNATYGIAYDYLYITRPQGGVYDIGAYEYDLGEGLRYKIPYYNCKLKGVKLIN